MPEKHISTAVSAVLVNQAIQAESPEIVTERLKRLLDEGMITQEQFNMFNFAYGRAC